MFDETARVGGMTFDTNGDFEGQISAICAALIKRVGEERSEEERATDERERAPELVEDAG
jgi:hypothetical protein